MVGLNTCQNVLKKSLKLSNLRLKIALCFYKENVMAGLKSALVHLRLSIFRHYFILYMKQINLIVHRDLCSKISLIQENAKILQDSNCL